MWTRILCKELNPPKAKSAVCLDLQETEEATYPIGKPMLLMCSPKALACTFPREASPSTYQSLGLYNDYSLLFPPSYK